MNGSNISNAAHPKILRNIYNEHEFSLCYLFGIKRESLFTIKMNGVHNIAFNIIFFLTRRPVSALPML